MLFRANCTWLATVSSLRLKHVVFLIAATVNASPSIAAPKQADVILAQRFRPYIKSTQYQGEDERFHPATWQWFIAHATMKRKGIEILSSAALANSNLLISPSGSDYRLGDSGLSDPGIELDLTDESYRSGEAWNDIVKNGDGVYAHVEHVTYKRDDGILDQDLINIEYTILWSYNGSVGSNHDGDLTTIVVVYSQKQDSIVRVIYSIHGCMLETIDLVHPRALNYAVVDGEDINQQPRSFEVARLDVDGQHFDKESTYKCGATTGSEKHMFLFRDPVSYRYEHPAIYAEQGSHEPWPNGSGFVSLAGAHDGNGVSFLQDKVIVLGALTDTPEAEQPFVYFNGKFGNDPAAIALHKTWFWPGTRALNFNSKISLDRFSDMDPYAKQGDLPLEPNTDITSGIVFAMPKPPSVFNITFDGTAARPFLGLALPYSLIPAHWTISLAPGSYAEPITFVRPMTLVAQHGPATLGTFN